MIISHTIINISKKKDLSQAQSGREEQGAANRSEQKRTENNSLTITMANCLFK